MTLLADRLQTIRAATSFLFVPGDRSERFDKAVKTGADLVILDLEDGVPPGHREHARQNIASWLGEGGRACVRINPLDSEDYLLDLQALKGLDGLVAFMLAKADAVSAKDLTERVQVPVIALIESCQGVAQAVEVAATTGVERIAFGHLDYAVDLGADPTTTAMLYARSILVQASQLAGLPGPVDGVTVALEDPELLTADTLHARELGMTGKLLIHPRQVAAMHDAFLPSEAEISLAKRILEAGTQGAARVDGEMVDAPRIMRAEAILRRAGI